MTRACTSSKSVVVLALLGNVLVAATKVAAAIATGSSAMVSEAVHSIVDTANEGLLLHGYRRAVRRPDLLHPLGYGRELYFWSFVVALMVFALGAGVSLYEGGQHVLNPRPVDHPVINYAVLALSFVFEGISWLAAMRKLADLKGQESYWGAIRQSKDPPSFMIFLEDSAALIGIVVAAIGIFLSDHFERPEFDGAASLIIGMVLASVATVLARESKSLLIGERASPVLVASTVKLAEEESGIASAHGAITVHLAPEQVLVALSVEFYENLRAREIEACVERIESRIRGAHPEIVTLFVKPQTREQFLAWRLARFGGLDTN